MYDRNIIIQNKNKLPIILDFGLSYNTKKIFHNKTIDIKIINKFYFTYKPNHYNHLHEKNFINFIINNTFESSDPDYENYFSLVQDVKKENDLTIENILICVSNFQKIFNNYYNKIYNLFSQKEFDYFLNSFEKYYTKFADKNKYPTYYEILSELLPNVFIYTDIYSIIFLYLEIFNNNNNNNNNKVKNPIIKILHLFFKKIILADPVERINPKQLKSMLNKIFNFIKKADPNDEKNEINNFIIEFDNNLKKIGINYDIFYNKTYAYIDFHEIFKNKLKSLKKLNFNF